MVKGTRSELNPNSPHKQNQVFVKFAISLLLVGLAFRLLVSDSFRLSSVVETPPLVPKDKTESSLVSLPLQTNDSVNFPGNQTVQKVAEAEVRNFHLLHLVAEKCDLFVGDWVPDPSGPVYTNESCHVIEGHQNCMRNGRPDSGFLYWRWSPRDCELPKFNPNKFLDLMRDKWWAFIGDSISRNHVQSLLCILSEVELAVEVYHDEEYRSKIWKFPSHNFTLSVIWSPLLIKAAIHEDMNGVSSSEMELYLDSLDSKWTEQFKNFDYVVTAGGKWFLKNAIYHENSKIIGCHACCGKNLTDPGFDDVYRKAIRLVFDFIMNSDHKATIFFRTTTPDHFEFGEWFSGGYCNRTVPFKEGQINLSEFDSIMRDIELEEFERAKAKSESRWSESGGETLKLLDTTGLSLLRPDGHPGPYRQFHPFSGDRNAKVQNDCLHWCLPGPIDSWNDLVMEMVINGR